MNKTGKWSYEYHDYKNLAKSNGVNVDDSVSKFICDVTTMNEQKLEISIKNEKQIEIMERLNEQNEMDKVINTYLGNFYFNFYGKLDNKLKPMNLVRFIYLCSYMDYENRLYKRVGIRNVSIYENELKDILNLGKTEYYSTKKELLDNDLIFINKDKSISINEYYCKKGKIEKNKSVVKMKMFNDGIRNLYENCTAKEHKKLSFLFDIIEYCHCEYNIICINPNETLDDQIKPINVKELCSILNFSNVTVFKNKLLDFKINNKPVFIIHNTNRKEAISINPQVYYNGNKLESLNGLLVLFGVLS